MSDNKLLAAMGALGGTYALWKWLDSNYLIGSDVKMLLKVAKVKRGIEAGIKSKATFIDTWDAAVKANPKKSFISFEGKDSSYAEVDAFSNKVAHWAKNKGVKKGVVVALYMENCVEYVGIWLGILKAGGICSLINYNTKGKPLTHSLKISGAKIVITGKEVAETMGSVYAEPDLEGFEHFIVGGTVDWPSTSLEQEIAAHSDARTPKSFRDGVTFTDTALLVYTSGTTGMPKAATIKHMRLYSMGMGFAVVFEILPADRIYTVLPLYHSAGGLCGVGMTIAAQATLCLRRKFSASNFWEDCRKVDATVVQYIGELCRYLLQVPPTKSDADNKVRIAIGNGLRPEIWDDFQDRFGIPEVGEFYGSTEGTAALFNHCTSKEARGCVGRGGPLVRKLAKLKLVKFDVANEEPIRGEDGFLVECDVDEPGELLGELDNDPVRAFAGYHGNKEATKKKIIENAFKKGDKYFRSGDLLKCDSKGYWHFVDRIGDTFRWKGENVSTTEVTQVVSVFPGVSEVNIYGISVPGKDGGAPMAAMIAEDSVDWAKLVSHCKDNLPSYAIPIFIRLLPQMAITGTFKHQKVELRKQGADPTLVPDKLLWLNPATQNYEPLGIDEWKTVINQTAKL
mmetsp:Transcript_28891/g.56713  ORF Transcript_28891/g.56713 Transcript_28891/m.56713 type:complete len:624 (+) Transcript_28891:47-1918(+)|eukprot:CAMPEP_0175145262 /NCGR_PEP_ID=MMETSP0087-20121206/14651_1 /TAXON_ID=136419 /ORGANISM="Unknown Unknown, Strain D1" /LENGTH=623 /DNA_ID=CAMNT_0016429945 /DNA_START=47 /DNA_END=1918 /DNA_ORIENTATION=-